MGPNFFWGDQKTLSDRWSSAGVVGKFHEENQGGTLNDHGQRLNFYGLYQW